MIRPAHSVLRLILISGKIYEASCLFFQSILASSFCFRQSTPHFHVLIALWQVRLLPSFVSRRVLYFQNLNPECVNLTLPTEPVSHPQFIGGYRAMFHICQEMHFRRPFYYLVRLPR